MKPLSFIVLAVMLLTIQSVVCDEWTQEKNAINATSDARSGRFLSLFSVVRFANSFCYGSNGLNGTCLTSAECASYGGTAAGSCASGFGVCCTVCITTCGKVATLNNTYWGNPGYPSTYSTAGQCSISVQKTSDICQFRLDFVNFDIADPSTTADTTRTQCLLDIFTVSGQSNNVPGICGTNANQHMYLDMTPGNNQFTLNMLLTGTATSRSWKIRISQIPCGANYLAPEGCLQWFTTAVGTFSSFNYEYVTAVTPTQHLANQDYTICIRTNQGSCGICYQVCDSSTPDANKFRLSVAPTVTNAAVDVGCTTDWIQIPCAMNYQSTTALLTITPAADLACAGRICGGAFSAKSLATAPEPVYSYRKPFEVRFYTTSVDAADESIGFCLKYQQLSCTSG